MHLALTDMFNARWTDRIHEEWIRNVLEYPTAKKYYEKALAASKITFGEDDAKTLEIIGIMERYGL